MTAIRYSAARQDGQVEHGTVDTTDRDAAIGLLVSRGLHPLKLTLDNSGTTRRSATRIELALLFRSLASLSEAGVPLGKALRATQPALRGPLREVIPALEQSLREGDSFSRALTRTRGVVPPGVVGMVRAGERASRLGEALDQTAAHLEQEAEFLARLQGALTYPAVLLATGLISVGVIAFVVLPRFAGLLADLGQDLPPSTRLLLGISTLLRVTAPYFPLLLVLFGGGAVALLRHPPARLRLAQWLLATPGIGGLRHSLLSARWLRGFGAALASGMPMLAALETAADASGDSAIRIRTEAAGGRIAQGYPVASALGSSQVITPLALQVVAIGEASGQLARMAQRAGDLAAQEGERRLRQVVSLAEPLLVLGFGAVVAFVAAALLQAVYALRPGG